MGDRDALCTQTNFSREAYIWGVTTVVALKSRIMVWRE
jgi:hypothetical protein